MSTGIAASARTTRSGILILALVAAEAVGAFESLMTVAVLPTFMKIFDVGAAQVGWVASGYLVVAAISAGICGRLGDMYGRKRVLLIVLAIAAVGSLVSAVSGNLTGVVIGRGIQGVSTATLPLSLALAREILPARRVPIAVGWIGGAAVVAGGIGTAIGGLLVRTASYHALFLLSTVLALVVLLFVWRAIPRSVLGMRQPLDYFGAVLFAVAVAVTLIGVTSVPGVGWLSPFSGGLILVGLVLLGCWIAWELRLEYPLVDLRLLVSESRLLVMIATAAVAVGPLAAIVLYQLLLQQPPSTGAGLGLDPAIAGALGLPPALMGLIGGPLSGAMAARKGPPAALLLGVAIATASFAVLLVGASSLPLVIISYCGAGFGISVLYGALPAVLIARSPAERIAELTGAQVVLRSMLTAVGTQIIMTILAASALHGTGSPAAWGYAVAAGVVLVALLGAALTGLMLWLRPGPATAAEPTMATSDGLGSSAAGADAG